MEALRLWERTLRVLEVAPKMQRFVPRAHRVGLFWRPGKGCLTSASEICSSERMRPNRLQNALTALDDAMREVNAAIEEMRREHDSAQFS